MNAPLHVIIAGSEGQSVTVFGAVEGDGRVGVSASDAPVFLNGAQLLDLIDALRQAAREVGATRSPTGYIRFEGQARFVPLEQARSLHAL